LSFVTNSSILAVSNGVIIDQNIHKAQMLLLFSRVIL